MSWAGRKLGVVVIGDAQVALSADGPLDQALMFRRTQTGDGLIAAVAAARLGVEVALVTRVGHDPFGEWLLSTWEEEDLHLDYARLVPGRNALTLVGADADGRQSLGYREGVAAALLDEDDVTPVPWELTRVVFAAGSTQALGPRPRAAILRGFELAREAGVTTVYDPLLRRATWRDGTEAAARAAFDELLPLTDVLVIDAPYAAGRLLTHPGAEECAREARRRGVGRVVVRRGRREVVVAEGDRLVTLPPVEPPEQVRTGGVGAAFDGALIGTLARGAPLVEAAEVAAQARALALGGRAGIEAIAWLDQLNAFRSKLGSAPVV